MTYEVELWQLCQWELTIFIKEETNHAHTAQSNPIKIKIQE